MGIHRLLEAIGDATPVKFGKMGFDSQSHASHTNLRLHANNKLDCPCMTLLSSITVTELIRLTSSNYQCWTTKLTKTTNHWKLPLVNWTFPQEEKILVITEYNELYFAEYDGYELQVEVPEDYLIDDI